LKLARESHLRQSGSPGLPSGWDVRPLGFVTEIHGGATPSKERFDFWDGHISWVSPKDMKSFEISGAIEHITTKALAASSVKLIPAGATLVVVRGMILAKAFPVGQTTVPVTINQDMKALVPQSCLHPRFLSWQLLARSGEAMSLIEGRPRSQIGNSPVNKKARKHGLCYGRSDRIRTCDLRFWRPWVGGFCDFG